MNGGMSLAARRRLFGVGVPVLLAAVVGGVLVPRLLGAAHDVAAVAAARRAAETLPSQSASADPRATAKAAVRAWLDGGGHRLMYGLDYQLSLLESFSNDADLDRLRDACADLKDGVDEAKAFRPFPDPAGQAAWSQALTGFQAAGERCGTLRLANRHELISVAERGEVGLRSLARRIGDLTSGPASAG